MLQLRYNGCPNCLSNSKDILAQLGMFETRNYCVEFHKDHRSDRIYKARPDYIKEITGAILYNPDTESWIDFYDNTHEKVVVSVASKTDRDNLMSSIRKLQSTR